MKSQIEILNSYADQVKGMEQLEKRTRQER